MPYAIRYETSYRGPTVYHSVDLIPFHFAPNFALCIIHPLVGSSQVGCFAVWPVHHLLIKKMKTDQEKVSSFIWLLFKSHSFLHHIHPLLTCFRCNDVRQIFPVTRVIFKISVIKSTLDKGVNLWPMRLRFVLFHHRNHKASSDL